MGGTQVTRQHKGQWRKLRKGSVSAREYNQLLDVLLALDRTVVELSMHAYNVPRNHQAAMREQNRRLHNAVRERVPRFLSRRASSSQI